MRSPGVGDILIGVRFKRAYLKVTSPRPKPSEREHAAAGERRTTHPRYRKEIFPSDFRLMTCLKRHMAVSFSLRVQ
jgi:hypothetical protein